MPSDLPDARFPRAGPPDEDSLLELMREFYAGERLPYREAVARRALGELWANPSLGRVHLVEAGGVRVGYVVLAFGFSLEFHGRDAFVDELYLREGYRGRGLGTAALEWVEEVCRSEGIRALHLEADRANDGAKRLYHRMGYADHDRHLLTKWIAP